MQQKISLKYFMPVMFGFFIMGFIDIVGIASNYIKQDFQLSDTVANLILMMVFVWFVLFSIPTGMLMTRIGRRKTVVLSILINAMALFLPMISYNFASVLGALALLGIGNAMLQVSLNPLTGDVVPDSKLASSLTFGQFIKSISSFSGPLLAGAAALYLGNWRYLFPLFGGLSIIAMIWLNSVKIIEIKPFSQKNSFKDSLKLLNDPVILGLFVGILMVVGIDVGLNVSVPKFLMLKGGLPLTEAGLGSSLYFAARTAGAFLGAVILTRIPVKRFYTITIVLAIVSLAFTLAVHSLSTIYIGIFLTGLTIANVFSIIYSIALLHRPSLRNEISGLMMMGIIGGAIIPLAIGVATDNLGLTYGMLILGICMVYLLFNSLVKKKAVN
jgi:MFS transporter, FHS family, L-fucose permease